MIDPQVLCGECNAPCRKVYGDKIYPHRPDLYSKAFYLCPVCGAYCGESPDPSNPRSPAGPSTRQARIEAHKMFDKLWREGLMTKSGAYRWLSGVMGIPTSRCHIGMMDGKTALKVASLALDKWAKGESKKKRRR